MLQISYKLRTVAGNVVVAKSGALIPLHTCLAVVLIMPC